MITSGLKQTVIYSINKDSQGSFGQESNDNWLSYEWYLTVDFAHLVSYIVWWLKKSTFLSFFWRELFSCYINYTWVYLVCCLYIIPNGTGTVRMHYKIIILRNHITTSLYYEYVCITGTYELRFRVAFTIFTLHYRYYLYCVQTSIATFEINFISLLRYR